MKARLILRLAFSFILSVLLTAIIFSVIYMADTTEHEVKQGLVILGFIISVFENLIFLVVSLLLLWLFLKEKLFSKSFMLVYLLVSPVTISVFFAGNFLYTLFDRDFLYFLIPTCFFCSINSWFYLRLRKRSK